MRTDGEPEWENIMVVVCSEPSEDDRVEPMDLADHSGPPTGKLIETGNSEVTVWAMPGYYDLSFARDVRVTVDLVLDIARALPTQPIANFLIRCMGLTAIAPAAVDSYSRFTDIGRVAFLGAGHADRILERFFTRSAVSANESEYFEDEAQARAWLTDQA